MGHVNIPRKFSNVLKMNNCGMSVGVYVEFNIGEIAFFLISNQLYTTEPISEKKKILHSYQNYSS